MQPESLPAFNGFNDPCGLPILVGSRSSPEDSSAADAGRDDFLVGNGARELGLTDRSGKCGVKFTGSENECLCDCAGGARDACHWGDGENG